MGSRPHPGPTEVEPPAQGVALRRHFGRTGARQVNPALPRPWPRPPLRGTLLAVPLPLPRTTECEHPAGLSAFRLCTDTALENSVGEGVVLEEVAVETVEDAEAAAVDEDDVVEAVDGLGRCNVRLQQRQRVREGEHGVEHDGQTITC